MVKSLHNKTLSGEMQHLAQQPLSSKIETKTQLKEEERHCLTNAAALGI